MIRFAATYASAGEGHRRAAEAVVSAAQGRDGVSAALSDCLAGSAAWFQWTYTQGYLAVVRHAPAMWGGLYAATDWWGQHRWLQRLRRWGNARQEQAFAAWLTAVDPAVMIATHFFPIEVATALKRAGRLRAKILCVITDWLPHAFWLCPGVDRYAVASEMTKVALVQRGIPAGQIAVTGIPVHHGFAAALDRPATAQRLGVDPARFTILIGSGGFGLGPIEALVRALGRLQGPYQLLVVAGRNPRLQRALETLRPTVRAPMIVYGFVHNMHELMAVSDLLISKSGGLTCAEAMARGLPMLIAAPIPGQETRNSEVLTEAGATLQARRIAEVPACLERLRDPAARQALMAAARRLGRPHAADDVVRLALELAHA